MSDDRRRVLVIEDDVDLARALSDLLEDDGFVVAQRPAVGSEEVFDLGRQHAVVLTWFGKQHKSLLYCRQ